MQNELAFLRYPVEGDLLAVRGVGGQTGGELGEGGVVGVG